MDERKTSSIPVPEGFDLSKYDQCRELTPGQWCHELERRRVTYLLPSLDDKYEPSPPVRNEIIKDVRAILLQPVVLLEGPGIFNSQAVRDVTIGDIVHISRFYEDRFKGHSDEDISARRRPATDYVAIPEGVTEMLAVDLSVSNKALIEQFKAHLEIMRARHPSTRKKPITSDKIKKLANYNVLAILDLLLFEQIAGRQLVRKDMAELLGIDYQTLVETRMPFALNAVSDEFLSDLAVISKAGA